MPFGMGTSVFLHQPGFRKMVRVLVVVRGDRRSNRPVGRKRRRGGSGSAGALDLLVDGGVLNNFR